VSACGFVLRKPRFLLEPISSRRDILRASSTARLSLWIGLSTALLSGLIGALLGVLSAQYRKFDALLMRLMDALMALPAILLSA
jgi:peptide/nickel transport system permease protein